MKSMSKKWSAALLLVNVLLGGMGGYWGAQNASQNCIQIGLGLSPRHVAAFSYSAAILGSALAFILPFQPQYQVRLIRNTAVQKSRKSRKVEIVFCIGTSESIPDKYPNVELHKNNENE